MRTSLRRVERTSTRCLVCGSGEVGTDEVIDRGLVFLAECPRCEHRWTQARALSGSVRPVARGRLDASFSEVAPAA